LVYNEKILINVVIPTEVVGRVWTVCRPMYPDVHTVMPLTCYFLSIEHKLYRITQTMLAYGKFHINRLRAVPQLRFETFVKSTA